MNSKVKLFVSVRDRLDITKQTIDDLHNGGEPVDIFVFDDSSSVDRAAVFNYYAQATNDGKISMVVANTEGTTGGYPWGKSVMIAQFAKLMELHGSDNNDAIYGIIDNDQRFAPGWLTIMRSLLEAAEERWHDRVAVVSPRTEAVHKTIASTVLNNKKVELKYCVGACSWLFRPTFFTRYGLPDLYWQADSACGHAGAEDWYYSSIFEKLHHYIVALKTPLAFDNNKSSHSARVEVMRKRFKDDTIT